MEPRDSYLMLNWLYRAKHIALILFGIVFLGFGIHLLVMAYYYNNPFIFIMTFFASNLIILISATLLIVFFLRLKASFKKPDEDLE